MKQLSSDPARDQVLRTLQIPNFQALLDAMQAAITLELVFDVRVTIYEQNNPKSQAYPRFAMIVYGVPAEPLKLPGVNDVQ